MGRFITPDTIVQAPSNPQTFNRYTYCNNNPINLVDPSGHSWKSFWKKAVGIIVGIVATIALGPGGALAWYGSTMAGIVGGALGGALTGGLEGGWKGALIGAAIGGALGGIGGKIFGGSSGASNGGTQLADASIDLGVISVVKDVGGSALGDAVGNVGGTTAASVLKSAVAGALGGGAGGGIAGAIGSAAAGAGPAISSAASYWAYESVLPGPWGQPVSDWSGHSFFHVGDPVGLTENAGGGWMWAERAALGVSAAASVGAAGVGMFSAGSQTIVFSGEGSFTAAMNGAANGFGRTIFQTPGGRMLSAMERFAGKRLNDGVWRTASNIFVRNAKGTVRGFLNNPSAQRTFRMVEEPILRARGVPIETYGPLAW